MKSGKCPNKDCKGVNFEIGEIRIEENNAMYLKWENSDKFNRVSVPGWLNWEINYNNFPFYKSFQASSSSGVNHSFFNDSSLESMEL